MLRTFALMLTVLVSLTAFAVVDMKNANFTDTWVDMIVPGSGYDLRVQRTYNSRSLFNGIFGFGWCSDFETSVEVLPDGRLKLTECGAGQETVFASQNFKNSRLKDVIKGIIAAEKKVKPAQNAEYWKTRARQIAEDKQLREFLAKKYKISAQANEGRVYLANGSEVEKIVYNDNVYHRHLLDGTEQRFNSKGQLIQMSDKSGNYLRFSYKGKGLKQVRDNNGRSLNFKMAKNGKVKRITGPNGLSVAYTYKGIDFLTSVRNAWGNKYAYSYDDTYNLTQITYPDGTTREVSYDKKRDWVIGFKDRSNCRERYDYQLDEQNPKMHYWADVKKVCKDEVTAEARYEFWYRKGRDGLYLHRARTEINSEVRDIVYHETFGKPVSIKNNNELTAFSYYKNGLVKARKNNGQEFFYKYNKKNKVSEVKTITRNKKGKAVKQVVTKFIYDKKGNLKAAANTDGRKVALGYDSKGRISILKDQSEKVVKIQYEERFGKPKVVTRPGMGSLKVSYDVRGTIRKVQSPEGPEVAIQVASAFNNLLDIIGPATSDLRLN